MTTASTPLSKSIPCIVFWLVRSKISCMSIFILVKGIGQFFVLFQFVKKWDLLPNKIKRQPKSWKQRTFRPDQDLPKPSKTPPKCPNYSKCEEIHLFKSIATLIKVKDERTHDHIIITTGRHKVQASLEQGPLASRQASLLHEIWESVIEM